MRMLGWTLVAALLLISAVCGAVAVSMDGHPAATARKVQASAPSSSASDGHGALGAPGRMKALARSAAAAGVLGIVGALFMAASTPPAFPCAGCGRPVRSARFCPGCSGQGLVARSPARAVLAALSSRRAARARSRRT
jgi:hypothetical protein